MDKEYKLTMEGLIPSQIGLASRVRPRGALKASWEAFLKEQIERDEAILFANRPEGALVSPLPETKERRGVIHWLKQLVP